MNTSITPRQAIVHAQLDRILASRYFRNAPRLKRFLRFVVAEGLAGREGLLKGYSIGLEVFDKSSNFDPQTDTIVRVQARALRQKLGQYYAQDGAKDPVRISIAKGTYAPVFDENWTAKMYDSNAVAEAVAKPSIAVLPFDDFSQPAKASAFSLGLAEEIIADLSRFKELSVFSRSTMQQAKSDGLSVQQMRARFEPDFVLEGSFRADDETVSVSINLVDAREDKIIYVDRFCHPLEPASLHAIQDETAQQIAWRISDSYGPIGQIAARAGRAGQSTKWETIDWIYRYYRKGVALDNTERVEIRAGLETAIAHDPGASDAYAVLAFTLLDEYLFEPATGSLDLLARALANAQKAVDCDSQSAIAYCALARAHFHLGDFAKFQNSADQALVLNPGHADMLAMLGMCFLVRGDTRRARPLVDKALLLNPLHPAWYHLIRAYALMLSEGPDVALAEMRMHPLPDKFFYSCHLIWMLVEAGDMDAAHVEKAALLDRFPEFERFIARHYRSAGMNPEVSQRIFSAWKLVGLVVE